MIFGRYCVRPISQELPMAALKGSSAYTRIEYPCDKNIS